MDKFIYLDNAATTFPKPEVVYESMDNFMRNSGVSAGRGSYKLSRDVNNMIDETRDLLLELINCSSGGEVIFSPSATIATNQILNGLEWDKIKNVYVSPFEHNAIMRTLNSIKNKYDININIIPFDNLTFELDEERVKIMFSQKNPDVLIMSHVSNVTGYILPINRCQQLAKEYNPLNIVDCAQSLGVIKVDVNSDFKLTDYIIFAGHKSLYGPFGIGGFIKLNSKNKLKTFIVGGTGSDSTNLEMPSEGNKRFEVGSYDTLAINGLNAALKWIRKETQEKIYLHKKHLGDLLIDRLNEFDGIEIYVPENLENHIGVISFNIEDYSAEDIGKILDDEFNICVRTGHHCAPLVGTFLDGMAVNGTVRVGLGYFNNEKEIRGLIEALEEISEG